VSLGFSGGPSQKNNYYYRTFLLNQWFGGKQAFTAANMDQHTARQDYNGKYHVLS
jgi:hypothetical protein